MDENEFAARTEWINARLYHTSCLYLGSENKALDAVDEALFESVMRKGKH